MQSVAPRNLSPSRHSTPARYIQPADPVYQVQPPRPTWGARIDVGADDIGLDLVAMDVRARARMVDRIEHREKLGRLVAVAERRERDDRPSRGMRILAAILANAGRIALDVAGVVRRSCRRAA